MTEFMQVHRCQAAGAVLLRWPDSVGSCVTVGWRVLRAVATLVEGQNQAVRGWVGWDEC